MKKEQVFPQIINITDLRYRWPKVERMLEDDIPIIILEHSTPKAVMYSFDYARTVFWKRGVPSQPEDGKEAQVASFVSF